MQSRFRYYSFSPVGLRCLCDQERWWEKARVAAIAILMGGIASAFIGYFDGLVYRSHQFQQAALGDEKGYEFLDYEHYVQWKAEAWAFKQTLAVLKDKPLKEIK